ncbi:tetratricopeptide repeat protein [Calycomorphotria hydatis]|uniref:Tetratricopeptide repeat protein n=1 Tax=Calycomorphotria hydatis TaxID=2528027 RepID=A0A517T9D1_9PLAN|nr:tetratricopeptide repeat protein [Calycomorphotria hydatis]QDT64980.1 Tetratricopeptide repeat protein [Calycomorphotria hydatis]
MSLPTEEPYHFKFQFLNDNGHPESFFRKKGRLEDEVLHLDDAEVPAAVITGLEVRDEYMGLVFLTNDGGQSGIQLKFPNAKVANRVKLLTDICRSHAWAKHHREQLEAKGRAADVRIENCNKCGAALILSDLPETPQQYCHYCATLVTLDPEVPVKEEDSLRLCDDCGYFSKPSRFTIFYFYFLVFFYGWWSKNKWCCAGCRRGDAWKMFFGNFLFILGLPYAIYSLIKAYGIGNLTGNFRGLDSANVLARSGKFEKAIEKYRTVLERVPISAGIKYNIGLALLKQNNHEQAAKAFELSLADCGNYSPSYGALCGCYEQIGEEEKLADLKEMWEDEPAEVSEKEDAAELEF